MAKFFDLNIVEALKVPEEVLALMECESEEEFKKELLESFTEDFPAMSKIAAKFKELLVLLGVTKEELSDEKLLNTVIAIMATAVYAESLVCGE
jgi:hypothetical protein